jgi:hypothetical protein
MMKTVILYDWYSPLHDQIGTWARIKDSHEERLNVNVNEREKPKRVILTFTRRFSSSRSQ